MGLIGLDARCGHNMGFAWTHPTNQDDVLRPAEEHAAMGPTDFCLLLMSLWRDTRGSTGGSSCALF